jgi:GH25 family lysozyme M1 (1,4-beta-N-acetylmuramidase)
MIPGIDLASYAHGDAGEAIDYAQVHSAGIQFAIVKYRDELVKVNPFFETDHAGFKAAGVATGSYVFLRPELELAPQAADLRMLAKFGPVFGDFEWRAGMSPAQLREWWGQLLQAAPDIGLYTSESWIGSDVAATALTGLLWVAWWGHATPPGPPAKLWQSTPTAEVPGVPGPVDIDQWLESEALLEEAFGQTPAPRPATTVDHPTVAAAAATPSGDGYYLITPQGDVWTFGDAVYHGSPRSPYPDDLVAILPTPNCRGYRLVTRRGFVGEFGDARPEALRRR